MPYGFHMANQSSILQFCSYPECWLSIHGATLAPVDRLCSAVMLTSASSLAPPVRGWMVFSTSTGPSDAPSETRC
jgi:hypothetical protein